jgi:hypothetical protein
MLNPNAPRYWGFSVQSSRRLELGERAMLDLFETKVFEAAELAASCDIEGIDFSATNGAIYLEQAKAAAADDGWSWGSLIQDHYVPRMRGFILDSIISNTMEGRPWADGYNAINERLEAEFATLDATEEDRLADEADQRENTDYYR